MSSPRDTWSSSVATAAAATATTLIAIQAWRHFAESPGGYLRPLALLGVVVAATGVATRWRRWPSAAVVLTQALFSGLVASWLITGSVLPGAGTPGQLGSAMRGAVESAQRYPAPVPATAAPIDPLLILGGLVCLLLVDLLACTLRRVPLAGLPLLTIFTVPMSMVQSPITWWVFTGTAAGFLTMLFISESEQISRWGRPIAENPRTGDPISPGAGAHAARRTAGGIGGAALGLALVVPLLVPSADIHLFDFGPGSGSGQDIRVDNPTADLVRDLKRGADTDLVRITTPDPDPSYLRLLTLTRFTDAEWTPGDREVPTDQTASGLLPPPDGVAADIDRREVPYDVTILPALDSTWLPTQYPAGSVRAVGDWRFDRETMDFLAVPDDLTTAGLSYQMTALKLDLTSADLQDAGSSTGQVSKVFTQVPTDVPLVVRQLATAVTDGHATRFEKALALQRWFREDGGFTYSLETAEGSGIDALTTFLTEGPGGRTGYCEQFASSMALMARLLGIPARVAIGFLEPTKSGPETWVYSSDDMHAWPELYFEGAGWVRFEPTPAGRASDIPAYTIRDFSGGDDPSVSAPAQSSASGPVASPRRPEIEEPQTGSIPEQAGETGSAWAPWVAVGGPAALVVVVLLLPRLVRRHRRTRRLAAGAPERVWAELQATAVDLGVPWPAGRSPRRTRDLLVAHLGQPADSSTPDRPAHGPEVAPAAVEALDRIVGTLERQRYSRSPAEPDRVRLRADAEMAVAALDGGATRGARRRARWWPRSVLGFTRRKARPATQVESRPGGVVDRVG